MSKISLPLILAVLIFAVAVHAQVANPAVMRAWIAQEKNSIHQQLVADQNLLQQIQKLSEEMAGHHAASTESDLIQELKNEILAREAQLKLIELAFEDSRRIQQLTQFAQVLHEHNFQLLTKLELVEPRRLWDLLEWLAELDKFIDILFEQAQTLSNSGAQHWPQDGSQVATAAMVGDLFSARMGQQRSSNREAIMQHALDGLVLDAHRLKEEGSSDTFSLDTVKQEFAKYLEVYNPRLSRALVEVIPDLRLIRIAQSNFVNGFVDAYRMVVDAGDGRGDEPTGMVATFFLDGRRTSALVAGNQLGRAANYPVVQNALDQLVERMKAVAGQASTLPTIQAIRSGRIAGGCHIFPVVVAPELEQALAPAK